jgi:hypothetical protein
MTADEVYRDLHRALPVRLFTITVHDPEAGLFRRAYTSHPVEYPVSGTKPVSKDRWSDCVIGEGRTFVANTTAGFADVFGDHAVITALGCASAANIPVLRADGAVAGTVNLLDVAGYFTGQRVAECEAVVAAHHAALIGVMI